MLHSEAWSGRKARENCLHCAALRMCRVTIIIGNLFSRYTDVADQPLLQRNPLGAILHCAEDIDDAVRKPPASIDFDAIHEAIDTISLCITHQKQIVDDVLSFSKLDANMLSLTPNPCQPRRGLEKAVQIFHSEFRKHSIEYNYHVDSSYEELGVSWVAADLARISQVSFRRLSFSKTYEIVVGQQLTAHSHT